MPIRGILKLIILITVIITSFDFSFHNPKVSIICTPSATNVE